MDTNEKTEKPQGTRNVTTQQFKEEWLSIAWPESPSLMIVTYGPDIIFLGFEDADRANRMAVAMSIGDAQGLIESLERNVLKAILEEGGR